MFYDARDCARLRGGVLLSSAAAWAMLLLMPEASCHCLTRASGATLGQLFAAQSPRTMAYAWLVMLVAMMGPMTLPGLYQVRISSFVSRRGRASALFLAGYGFVWMAAGVVLTVAEIWAKWRAPGSFGPTVAIGVVALVWQASPLKQRCLNRCHGHRPLAAFGIAAARDALAMGLSHGGWCVGSCWALMLLPMLLPEGHLWMMGAVTLVMYCERLDPPSTPAWRMRGFRTAGCWLKMRLPALDLSPPPGSQRS